VKKRKLGMLTFSCGFPTISSKKRTAKREQRKGRNQKKEKKIRKVKKDQKKKKKREVEEEDVGSGKEKEGNEEAKRTF